MRRDGDNRPSQLSNVVDESKQTDVLCVATQQANAEMMIDKCPTLTKANGTSGSNKPYVVIPDETSDRVLAINERQHALTITEDIANTLTATDYKGVQLVFAESSFANHQEASEIEGTLRHVGGAENLVVDGKAESVLCLNDQGGSVMNVTEDVTGTLRSQEHGHEPIVFEPGSASRVGGHVYEDGKTGTLRFNAGDNQQAVVVPVSETEKTAYGICSLDSNSMKSPNPKSGFYEATSMTLDQNGGNPACNQGGIAIVEENQNTVYCLQDNGIDRTEKSGCNGKGFTKDVSYTLTSGDRHAVAYGVHENQRNVVRLSEEISPTLNTGGVKPGQGYACVLEEKTIGAFSPLQGADAGSIAYSEEVAPTLRTSGNPAVMYDAVESKIYTFVPEQGGSAPNFPYDEDLSSTLQTTKHVAVLIENHPADSRVKLSEDGVVQTLSARMGTGGGNVPLLMDVTKGTLRIPFTVNYDASAQELEGVTPTLYSTDGINGKTFISNCPQDNSDPADPPLTITCDSYAQVCEDSASTLMARDYKDSQVVIRPKCVVRRLAPTECLRLQGFPDAWLDGESDTAKYAAIGNSVALPCVDYIMQGIAESLYPEDYPQPEPYPIVY